MRSMNPATGELLREWAPLSQAEAVRRVELAAATQRSWAELSFAERAAPMERLAGLLREHRERLAQRMVDEVGKLRHEALGEIDKCAWVCEHYAEHAEAMLAPEPPAFGDPIAATDVHVRFDPLGVVLAIMPWNFPFWQVLRFGAPALMAGNTVLVKHAPNTLGCSEDIAELAREAGFPEGALQDLRVEVEQVPALIHHPAVAAVTVTGSERAGAAVAAEAGRALKKCVLELGGSDPFVVLPDADLDEAVRQAVVARVLNAGQTCCAAKRFLVHADVAADFEARFSAAMQATPCAPLVRDDIRANLQRQVDESLAAGARLVCGGEVPSGAGWHYPPTILADVEPGMAAFDEETFGPVAAIVPFSTLDEALELANASAYGLTASVWTADLDAARELARKLQVGGVFVNRMPGSDPRIPFGGVGRSGYGRELGIYGIREFVNIKTVFIA